jgi:hypothetical protein
VNVSTEAVDVSEYTADLRHLVHILVDCRMCELSIALQLLVFTIYKCSINPIKKPNSVYSYSYAWQFVRRQLHMAYANVRASICLTLYGSVSSFMEHLFHSLEYYFKISCSGNWRRNIRYSFTWNRGLRFLKQERDKPRAGSLLLPARELFLSTNSSYGFVTRMA